MTDPAHPCGRALLRLAPPDREVLALVASGATAATIARRLSVSERTVRRRLRSAEASMGVGTPVEAVVTAVRHGLI